MAFFFNQYFNIFVNRHPKIHLRHWSNVVARNIVARKHIAEVVYECCWQHLELTLYSATKQGSYQL